MMSFKAAVDDVVGGGKNYEFWMTFGLNDVRAKYRRSKLGQWWITLSVAIFILVIGILYGRIFKADSNTYMAYLAIGYITWLFIQDSVSQGCLTLQQAKPFLMQRSWAISTFIYRLIYREILMVAHHAILLLPIFVWLKIWPGFYNIALSLLGFFLVVVAAFFVALFLSIFTLRFRDMPPIIASLMRMAFFATPIIWVERNLGTLGELVALFNPFGYFISIVRSPLLGEGIAVNDWLICIGLTMTMAIISLTMLAYSRKKLAYWQ